MPPFQEPQIATAAPVVGDGWEYSRLNGPFSTLSTGTRNIGLGFIPLPETDYEFEASLSVIRAGEGLPIIAVSWGTGMLNGGAAKIAGSSHPLGATVGAAEAVIDQPKNVTGLVHITGLVRAGHSPQAINLQVASQAKNEEVIIGDLSFLRFRAVP
ncbi:MAG TPA: hypothetical protein VF655_00170 [Allosphingosinicella sp.]|jgi:hypothetical protein